MSSLQSTRCKSCSNNEKNNSIKRKVIGNWKAFKRQNIDSFVEIAGCARPNTVFLRLLSDHFSLTLLVSWILHVQQRDLIFPSPILENNSFPRFISNRTKKTSRNARLNTSSFNRRLDSIFFFLNHVAEHGFLMNILLMDFRKFHGILIKEYAQRQLSVILFVFSTLEN